MATAREILELIITGNSQGAVAEMDKVAARSRATLGATQRDLDALGNKAMTFGVAATGAGLVAAAGLYRAAQGAGQLSTDIGRIEGNLGDAAGAAVKFVRDANGIGLSDRAAASAVASIAELAVGLGIAQKQAGALTTETVELVSQLATLKGQTPTEGLDAMRSALIGEYDPLQRLVPSITAASIEHRALSDSGKSSAKSLTMAEKATATFAIVLESARDTLSRAGSAADNTALKNAKLAASWDDLKTKAGAEALPAMEAAVSAATGAADAFTAVDDTLGGIPSKLAVVATGATLAAGAMALLASGVIKTNSALRTAEGGLNRYGAAAKGVGAALTVLVASDMVFDWINDASGRADQAADAINRMKLAAEGASGIDPLTAFSEGVANEQNTLRLQNLWQEFGAEIDLVGTGVKADVEQVQRYFGELRQSSPKAAAAALDALEKATDGLDRNSRQYRINREFIDRNRESLHLAAEAAAVNADKTDGAADANKKAGAAAQDASRGLDMAAYSWRNTGDAASGAKSDILAYSDAMSAAFNPVFGLIDANDRLADAQKRMADAARTDGKDVQDATRNLADAQANLNKVLKDDPLFGLRQVSPEVDLAEARNRLADANRRLAENPRDADALTARDEAVSDMEAANKRAQDLKRQGQQRAEAISSARRQVEDAQTNLAEVQSRHGLRSDEYRSASQDVVRANFEVEQSTLRLAEYLNTNGVAAVGALKAKLDEWIAMGGPVADAAQRMKTGIDPLVAQVLILAAGLNDATGAAERLEAFQQKGVWRWTQDMLGIEPSAPTKKKDTGNEAFRRAAAGSLPTGHGFTGFGFSTGGLVPGVGFGDTVPAMLTPGEFVLSRGDVAAFGGANRIETIRRNRATTPVGGPKITREGDLAITATINQVVRDDAAAGDAAIGALRGIAHRAGKGLRASNMLGGGR